MSHHDHDDEHDIGFALDRRMLLPAPTLTRRRALGLFAGVAGAAGAAATLLTLPASAGAATTASTSTTPSETGGPYPADGSNGPDVLDDDGVVRRNIRSSFGTASGTAAGVPLRIRLTVLSAGVALPGAAVYLWHCDALGRYSLYSSGVTGENYLRGIQVTTKAGLLRFTSTFPGCYSGRWPHLHYEVYPSLTDAKAATNRLLTSQIALPEDACRAVYATSQYSGSAANLSRTSLTSDMVFSDSYTQELATMSGNVDRGYTAAFTVQL